MRSFGKLPRGDVSAYHARQIRSLGDEGLNKQLSQVWGEVRGTPAEKKTQIARYKLPKSIDFIDALPRDPNGKLYKRRLRDPYWAGERRAI